MLKWIMETADAGSICPAYAGVDRCNLRSKNLPRLSGDFFYHISAMMVGGSGSIEELFL